MQARVTQALFGGPIEDAFTGHCSDDTLLDDQIKPSEVQYKNLEVGIEPATLWFTWTNLIDVSYTLLLFNSHAIACLLVVSMSQTTRMVTELDLFYWPILLHTTYILSCIHIPITSLCSIHVIAQYITPCVHVNGIFHTINKMLVLMHWSKLL